MQLPHKSVCKFISFVVFFLWTTKMNTNVELEFCIMTLRPFTIMILASISSFLIVILKNE